MGTRVGQYLLFETIGRGAFGKVKLGVHADTGEQVAVKILEKALIKQHDLTTQVRREIAIMKALKHKNIVNLHTVLTSKTKLYIVMDLVTGGELFSIIAEKGEGGLAEPDARRYFQMLVDGVHYCHRRGVCHRDIKPENLLLSEDGELKLTDFGLSSIKGASTASDLLTTQCGTPSYVPPEIILHAAKGYSGQKVDAWACGIMLYAMVTGYLPFDGEDISELFMNIQTVNIEYPEWVPPGAIDLMEKLLNKDPVKRWDLKQVKQHPWFVVDYTGDEYQRALKKKQALEQRMREKREREKREQDLREKQERERFQRELKERREREAAEAAAKAAAEQAAAEAAAAKEAEAEAEAARQQEAALAQQKDAEVGGKAGEVAAKKESVGTQSSATDSDQDGAGAASVFQLAEGEGQENCSPGGLRGISSTRAKKAKDASALSSSKRVEDELESGAAKMSLADAVESISHRKSFAGLEEDDELSMAQTFPDREEDATEALAGPSAAVNADRERERSAGLHAEDLNRRGLAQKAAVSSVGGIGGASALPKRMSGLASRPSFRNISVASSFGQSFRASSIGGNTEASGAESGAMTGKKKPPTLLGSSSLAQAAALGQSTSLLSSRIGFSVPRTASVSSNEAAALAASAAKNSLGQSTSLLSSRIGFNMPRVSSAVKVPGAETAAGTAESVAGVGGGVLADVEAEQSDEETQEEQKTLSEEQRVHLQSIRRLETIIAFAKHQSKSLNNSSRSIIVEQSAAPQLDGERRGSSAVSGKGGVPRRTLQAQPSMRMSLSMRKGSVMLQSSRAGFPGAFAALSQQQDEPLQASMATPQESPKRSEFAYLMAMWDEGFPTEANSAAQTASEGLVQRQETLNAVKYVRERLERETKQRDTPSSVATHRPPLIKPEESKKLQSMLGIWQKKLEQPSLHAAASSPAKANDAGNSSGSLGDALRTRESAGDVDGVEASKQDTLSAEESQIDDATLTTLQHVLRLWDESILGDAAPAEVELATVSAAGISEAPPSAAVGHGERDQADLSTKAATAKPAARFGKSTNPRLQDSLYQAADEPTLASEPPKMGAAGATTSLTAAVDQQRGLENAATADLADDDFELGLRKGYLNDAWKKALVPAQDSFAALGALDDDEDDDDDDDDDNDSKGGESDDDNFVEAKGEQRPIAEVISEPDLRIYDDEAARENDGSMDAQRGSEASNLVEEMKRAARAPQKAVDESRERQIAAAASAAAEAIGGMPAGSLPAPTRTLYGRLGYTPSVILDPARPGFTSNVAAAVANNPTKASPAAGFGGETKFEVAESAAAANSAAQRPRHISDLKPQAFIAASMLDETGSADSPANSQRSVLETETLLKDPASALNEGMRQDSQVSVDENGGAHGSGGSSKATSRRNSLLGSKQKKAASNSGGAKRNVSNKVMALFSRATSRGSSAAVANTRFMSHFEPSQCFLEMGRLMTRMGGDVARKRDAHELKVRVLFQERQVHAKIDVVRAADTSGSGSLVTFRKAPGEPFDAALHQAFFDEVRAQFAAIGDGAVSA